jgi:hypothetical protein
VTQNYCIYLVCTSRDESGFVCVGQNALLRICSLITMYKHATRHAICTAMWGCGMQRTFSWNKDLSEQGVTARPGARFGPSGIRQGSRRIAPEAGWSIYTGTLRLHLFSTARTESRVHLRLLQVHSLGLHINLQHLRVGLLVDISSGVAQAESPVKPAAH